MFHLSQCKYMTNILHRASLIDCTPISMPMPTFVKMSSLHELFSKVTKYQSIAGALKYLTITHLDLTYPVNYLCQHMHSSMIDQWLSMKCILCYIKVTLDYGLHFQCSPTTKIHTGRFYSNWASDLSNGKPTSGFIVFSGKNIIMWTCRKQKAIACSSTKVEYKEITYVSAELTRIVSLLTELGLPPSIPPQV